MKFVGLDLGGVNSLACVRDDAGAEAFQGSAHPERPSCVLLPLVRKEKLLAGDEALRNERGSGLQWPPLAMTARDGWSRASPPANGGRVLIATVWQRLNTGGQWADPQWQPPDGLPALNKPTPAESLTAEARSVLKQTHCDAATAQAVIAIPNQLPEEAQESLLGRLPAGSRLVWRSVAAAMSWADVNASQINAGKHLAVLDVGLNGVEISEFEFRQQETDGRTFHVPVRRLNRLRFTKTDTLLADNLVPFSLLRPDLSRLDQHLGEISNAIGGQPELLICGPLAEPLLELLQRRFPHLSWSGPAANAVARGSCLFAWRLARGWPTYLDVLASLELFTLTEEHEPNWLALIPTDCEVSGGRDFQQILARRIFIEKDTPRLASWLQRSGEAEFRKLSTDLPMQAARNAWVDLNVSARSAGGFARVRITPSPGQFDVFGARESVLLNWQNMERIPRGPQEKWPVMLKYGWPACGKLYAHRPIFEDFLLTAEQELTEALEHRMLNQRIAALRMMKLRAAKTIAPHLAGVTGAGGDAAPVNLLVCFGTEAPCAFMDGGYGGRSQISKPLPSEDDRTRKIARLLWQRLKVLNADAHAVSLEVNAVVSILGRMSGYAPDAFQNQLAGEIHPITNAVRLFAAGRVLQTPEHGLRLFETVKEKADFGQVLNNNWLRMLVYVLYQRPDVLKEVPREHVVASASLCLDVFEQQAQQGNVRILFINSLRALALLLRVRRHAQARDFLCPNKCSQDESRLANRFSRVLRQANYMRLPPGPKTLVERVTEWLDFVASTDEMPPIVPPDEDDEAEGPSDD
jgi:hypothetical protein